MPEDTTAEVRRVAEDLLRDGRFGGPASAEADVLPPLAVHAPDGTLSSWFVPVAEGEALIGFAELLPDLTMTRYSSFQRHPRSTEGCPPVAAWTQPSAVLGILEPHLRPGETPGAPVLTFDGVPARLAWAVDVAGPDGTRTLYVAGSAVWEATEGPDDTFGGQAGRGPTPPRTP